ncbi:phosphatidate cytidylyltransferase [Micromonospora olivasterospora]|uniref:Phosphatidate cytidylyltransferase n=1 Tax=Micromonospora olivasterospora TaxID=1880 RepID=A0A562IDP4_MICOL|nr:phosphatidate cytidylyltransferase [Micromonospora olivasterospora]TWH68865.1 phosphatidate cytidylyltransferase [Micromonospora olivasterospora]
MSHLDPYSGAEPRGWDRPDAPAALPWPDRDLEPGAWARGGAPDTYARAVPDARPEPHRPAGRGPAPFDVDASGPYGAGPVPHEDEPAWGSGYPPPGGASRGGPGRTPYPDDATRDFPAYADDSTQSLPAYRPERVDEPGGHPYRPEPAVPEPERPPGRRQPGRRRASADRPPTQQASHGRAGRNLPAAIGVGVALGAAVLLPLFLYRAAFLVVIAAAVAVGTWEMARAVRRGGAHPPLVPLVSGGVLTVGLAWFAGPDALSLGLLVTVLGTMIWRLGDGPGNYQRDLAAATLIAVYVPFLGGFAAMLAAPPDDGQLRVLVTLVAVVLSDTGGYAAGVAFGKHPMAPTISPKKSWEGFAGSVAAAAAGSALLIWLLFDVAPWWGALFGVAVSGAAVLGDLAESMIKRDLGVKDMSNLLPGHGGLMDRLDSILFAVPVAYLLLAVFVPLAV